MEGKTNNKREISNSYCVEYDSEHRQFVIGLAKQTKESLQIHGIMVLDATSFGHYFLEIIKVLAKYQNDTGINLLKQIIDDMDKGGDNK